MRDKSRIQTGCSCSEDEPSLRILEHEDLSNCMQSVQRAAERQNWTSWDYGYDGEQLNFVSDGRIGYFIGNEDSDEKYCGCAGVAHIAGDFVVAIESRTISKRDTTEGVSDSYTADLRLYFYPRRTSGSEALWEGQLRVSKDADGRIKASVKPNSKGTGKGKPKRKYNWRCLAACAPGCITCLADITCWTICAGACVIACAIDG